ncbi:MAG TPA: FtsX-like permease family protein [Candidatus Binatia bacterium]|jgi:putative ABC transport system permease protein|nr:FtsX-like permease family protein [Candidatus Binatia bacterium]
MLTWIEIAFRNLRKNRRRSFFTILAVALGFAAVNVFGGFSSYVFTTIKDGEIYALGNGHLTIFKKGFLTRGKLDPLSYLLSEAETQTIQEVLRGFSEVAVVTRQLHISGLLSNGKVSTIFIAAGCVPSDMQTIRNYTSGLTRRLRPFVGKELEDDTSYGVGLSSGLAEQLELGMNSTAIAMAPTVDGQINALDVQVFQLFETALDVLNDKLMRVPLKFAQTLYDTTSVDRITVLLKDTEQVEPARAALQEALAQRGLDVEIKTWRELSVLYNKVRKMFDIIFLFLFIVVLIIAVMSVINTISMTVVERTREIGTLRALGVKRRGIIKLFALESAMLGTLGALAGMGLTWMSWLVVKILEPQWVPPLVSQRLPLTIDLVPEYMVWSAFFLVVLSVGAASFPARQAAHQDIVEALGHV